VIFSAGEELFVTWRRLGTAALVSIFLSEGEMESLVNTPSE